MKYKILPKYFLLIFAFCCCSVSEQNNSADQLEIYYSKESAIIEIGGPYVGIEMHRSSPSLNRISFFYPAANSIDNSQDYWTREKWQILGIGIKEGQKPKYWLGLETVSFKLTPYAVTFFDKNNEREISISYEFCFHKPAMVFKLEVKNLTQRSIPFEIFTQLDLSLKTCHTYQRKTPSNLAYDSLCSSIYADFDYIETKFARLFLVNAGEQPISFDTNGDRLGPANSPTNLWLTAKDFQLKNELAAANCETPVGAYFYQKKIEPGKKFSIVQIIGTAEKNETTEIGEYLIHNYQREIDSYEKYVLQKSQPEKMLLTGDEQIDHSVRWAGAILAANEHYLDGHFVPMPCPAQYNFYFTHDVLLTDLAVVNFDCQRVRRDLDFIASHAMADGTIPHAYYWKDSTYATEYAGNDNWNHIWFVQLSASYLRHSGDIETLNQLYPLLLTSIQKTQISKQSDDLMWARQPDWWDIGNNFGPRAYMTILAIRSLRDFIFISNQLQKNLNSLPEYENIANRMQQQLNKKLWDDKLHYLINYYEDGSLDSHYYIGSLLACHFDIIPNERKEKLLETAESFLWDTNLGIKNVFPMDFHERIQQLKFNGKEMGEPFFYANGAVWPHGNAWFALALKSIGQREKAMDFIKKIMTVKSVMNSPNGQPAMYEYRNTAFTNPEIYGRVDKPQFLWAAGWYLYSLYHNLLLSENEWNIELDPFLPADDSLNRFELTLNSKPVTVEVSGQGQQMRHIYFDNNLTSTAVLPKNISLKKIKIAMGAPEFPYIETTNSNIKNVQYDNTLKILTFTLDAFLGHINSTVIIAPQKPKSILQNREKFQGEFTATDRNDYFELSFNFKHKNYSENLELVF